MLQLWDTGRGIIVGSATLDPSVGSSIPGGDARTLAFVGGGLLPLRTSTGPQQWGSQLSSVVDEELTDAELRLLPPSLVR